MRELPANSLAISTQWNVYFNYFKLLYNNLSNEWPDLSASARIASAGTRDDALYKLQHPEATFWAWATERGFDSFEAMLAFQQLFLEQQS